MSYAVVASEVVNRFLAFISLALLLVSVLAEPATADDQATCFGGAAGKANLDACTRLIVSKELRDGDLIRAYMARVVILARISEDFNGVIADCSKVLRLDPKNVDALAFRAASYQRKGDYGRALADANEAQRLGPKSILAHNVLSGFYNRNSDYDRALAEANESLRLGPNGMYGLKNRGMSLENKGELGEALASYRAALALDPQRQERAGRESAEGIERIEKKLAIRTPATPSLGPEQSSPTPSEALGVIPGRRVALVIGNGEYRFANRLPNPPNDAADLVQLLKKLGFDVVDGINLDHNRMVDAIREFGHKLDQTAIALFFYAGHGLQVSGNNYLVPIDAKLERAGDLNFEAIDINLVLQQMEATRRVNLVFLDACRDNPLSRSLARSLGTRSTAVGSGLASIQSGVGTMISFATRPDTVALDGEGRNSPFTAALLKHLATPNVDVGLLMRRVRADVIATTREKQEPWDNSSLVGEVILAR
jgi:tetratricopeptide (TPR) repeat protein